MAKIWTLIPARHLPEMIADMVYPSSASGRHAVPISVTRDEAAARLGNATPSSPAENTVTGYELPDDMLCSWHSDKATVVTGTLADWLASDSGRKSRSAYVQMLPTVMAHRIEFFSEQARKEFQSNRDRLLKGRGDWIDLAVGELPSGSSGDAQPPEPTGLPFENRDFQGDWDKLAAGIATAIIRGGTQLRNNLRMSFDPGTLALVRQLTQPAASVPDHATVSRDYAWLVKTLSESAKERKLKLGKLSQKVMDDQPNVSCLGQLISANGQHAEDLAGSTSPENHRGIIKDIKSAQEWLFTFVCRGILECSGKLDVQTILGIVTEAGTQLPSAAAVSKGASRISGQDRSDLSQALDEIRQNIEHAQQPIAEFGARFVRFPVIVALAYVFWSWSADPIKNFSARSRDLRSDVRAFQFATTLMAVCLGGGGLPPRSLAEKRWRGLYRRVWDYLLTGRGSTGTSASSQDLWSASDFESVPTSNGMALLVHFKNGTDESIKVEDPALAAMSLMESALAKPEQRESFARLLLHHIHAPDRTMPASLQRQLLMDISFPVTLPDHSDGRIRTYRDLRVSDLRMVFRWANPRQVAEALLRGNMLKTLVSALSEQELSALVADLRPTERERPEHR